MHVRVDCGAEVDAAAMRFSSCEVIIRGLGLEELPLAIQKTAEKWTKTFPSPHAAQEILQASFYP